METDHLINRLIDGRSNGQVLCRWPKMHYDRFQNLLFTNLFFSIMTKTQRFLIDRNLYRINGSYSSLDLNKKRRSFPKKRKVSININWNLTDLLCLTKKKLILFLVADTQLYKRLCPSVLPLVHPSVHEHESKSGKTRISAPAHPSATGIGRVSGLVLKCPKT